MGRVGFRGRDRVRTTFSDRNVVPGLTKYFDDDSGDLQYLMQSHQK